LQCAEALKVQAYFDGEADAITAVGLEAHLEHCAECAALLEELRALRTALRREIGYPQAPAALASRIAAALDREEKSHRDIPGALPLRGRRRSFWTGAFSGIGATAAAAGLAFFMLAPRHADLPEQLASAHIRSLMPDHLIDVVSSDQHTVKPWFAGHADVSPAVADFESQGFRLVGGRADYFDHQRAAVVVYQHGSHIINVFSWAAGDRGLPGSTTRNGYHMEFWRTGNLAYCAVSDAGWNEVSALVKLLQTLEHGDPRE
jgi:anti-sigma factor RsiW